MSNTIEDLREQLFDTIKQLKDPAKPLAVDRARAISDLAGQIIQSAKVEVDMLRVVNGKKGTGFVPLATPEKPQLTGPATAPKVFRT